MAERKRGVKRANRPAAASPDPAAESARTRLILGAILDKIPGLILVVDREFRVLEASAGVMRFFGLEDKAQVLGRRCFEALRGLDSTCPGCAARQALETGRPATRESTPEEQARAGHPFTVFATPILDQAGGVVGAFECAMDTSALLRAEAGRRESEARLKRAEALAHVGWFEADLESGRFFWSDEIFRILGLGPGEVEPSLDQLLACIHPEDRAGVLRARNEALAGLKPYDLEFRCLHKDGEVRVLHAKAEIERNEAGWPVRLFGTGQDITRRRQAEDRLRESEERFRRLAENARDIIYRWSFAEGRYEYINQAVSEISGHPPEAFYANPGLLASLVHPDMAQWFEAAWEDFLRGRVPPIYEYKIRHADGSERWLHQRNVLVLGVGGEPLFLEGMATDITDRKRAEDALRASEERYRTMVETCNEGVMAIDADMRITYVNKVMAEMLGYGEWELLRLRFPDLLFEEDLALHRTEVDRRRKGLPARFERRFRRKDGGELWVFFSATALWDRQGNYAGAFGMFTDITERRLAEEALKASEERFRKLFENAPLPYQSLDGEGRFLDVNQAWLAALGFGKEEVLGRGFWEFLATMDRETFEAGFAKVKSAGALDNVEFEMRRKDGGSLLASISGRMQRDGVGNFLRTHCIFVDVTEQRRMEQELDAARRGLEERVRARTEELLRAGERVRTLTRMLIQAQEGERQRVARELHDNVAQDLFSLKLACETMLDDAQGGSMLAPEALFQRRSEFSRAIQGILASVRDLSHDLHPSGLEHFGLARALARHCDELSRQKDLPVEFSAAGVEGLRLDPETTITLYRLVQEALNNAARHAQASRVAVRLVASHPSLILRVEDDGVGFDPALREAEAFAQKRMGLSGMRERVGLLGGSLDIQSRPGRGTRIVITIPSGGRHG